MSDGTGTGDINIDVDFDTTTATGNTDALTRAIELLSDKIGNLSPKVDRAADRTQTFAQQQQAAATQTIAFVQRLGAASAAVQQLASAFGGTGGTPGLISHIAQSTVSFAQLGAALGPGGAVVGGITGALIPAFDAMIHREDAAAAAARALSIDLRTAIGHASELAQQQALIARVSSGTGSATEQTGYLAQAQERQRLIQRALDGDVGSIHEVRRLGITGHADTGPSASSILFGTESRRATLTGQERELLTQLAQRASDRVVEATDYLTSAVLHEVESGAAGGTGTPTSRGGGGRGTSDFDTLIGRLAGGASHDLQASGALGYGAGQNATPETAAARQQAIVDGLVAEREERDRVAEATQRQYELEADAIRERGDLQEASLQKMMDIADRQREAHATMVAGFRETTGVLSQGLTDALVSIATGAETAGDAFKGLLAAFLQYLSQKATLKAADEYAEAIAALASYNYAGFAQHTAAGVAFTAVAVATGIGGAALAQKPAAPSGAPASPPSGSRGARDRDQTTVINFNSPVVTASTEAELGRGLSRMIGSSERRYGRA